MQAVQVDRITEDTQLHRWTQSEETEGKKQDHD